MSQMIHDKIRKIRDYKGFTQDYMAEKLSLSQKAYSKIERGERKATREQITKLADILELDKESLLIQYLSEKILYEIQDEDLGIQALKVAEKTIKYGVTKNK